VRGRPDRGKRNGPAVRIFEAFDRRIGRDVQIGIVGSGHGRPDDADRRALGVGAHDSQRPEPDAEVGAAGDHRLQSLARALGIEDVEHDAMLSEDAGILRELRDRLIPDSLGPDRELERILRHEACVSREQKAACNHA
jgi:hypothetical protein